MKREQFRYRVSLAAMAVMILAAAGVVTQASADTNYWDGTAISPGSWDTLVNWSTASDATTPDPSGKPGAADDVVFNITTVNSNQVIHMNAANQSANSLTFNSTNTVGIDSQATDSTTSRSLFLGVGGLTVGSAAGPVRIGGFLDEVNGTPSTANSSIVLTFTDNTTISNDGNSSLSISRRTSNTGDMTLTFDGTGTGVTEIGGGIGQAADTTVGVNINHSGTVYLRTGSSTTGDWSFLQGDVVSRGSTTLGSGNVIFSGGSFSTIGTGTRSYPNNITINGDFQLGGVTVPAIGHILAQTSVRTSQFNGTVDLGGDTRTLTIGSANIFNGVISNGGIHFVPLNSTSRTVTFGEANTYSGSTTVGANLVLALNNNLALQNSALNTSGGGTVTLGAGITTPTIGGLNGSTALASVMTTGYSSATNLTLNPGDGVVAIYSGAIANGASGMTITKTGNGTQSFEAGSSYSGGTILNAGRIAFRTSSNPLGTGTLTINGGAIGSVVSERSLGNSIIVNADFQLGGVTVPGLGTSATKFNGDVDLGGGTRMITLVDRDATFNGALSNGGLTLVANSTSRRLILGGNSTYTGPTTVSSGILELKTNALSSATALDIRSGAEVRLSFAGTNVIYSLTVNGELQKRGVYAAGSLPGLTGTAGAYLQTLMPPPKGTVVSFL